MGHDPNGERASAHRHAHGRDTTSRKFAVGIGLNSLFVLVELVAGVASGSVALVADAAHNFSDVLGLALAWGAARLAQVRPSSRRTYGLRRSTILASLANAILLLVGVGGVSWEAVSRLRDPSEAAPNGAAMLIVAAVGVVVNGGTALLFMSDQKKDTNVRGAYLHLVADAAVSLGVVIAGVLVVLMGWTWVDPVVSLVVSVVILVGTWGLLRDALDLALDAVPSTIDPDKVREYLANLPDVRDVHDLHIWALSTTETALTGHLVIDPSSCAPSFLRDLGKALEEKFEIHHTTIQMEPPDAPDACVHAPDEVL